MEPDRGQEGYGKMKERKRERGGMGEGGRGELKRGCGEERDGEDR